MNPYGEDDEDFDTNWMVDRHLQVSYMMVSTKSLKIIFDSILYFEKVEFFTHFILHILCSMYITFFAH